MEKEVVGGRVKGEKEYFDALKDFQVVECFEVLKDEMGKLRGEGEGLKGNFDRNWKIRAKRKLDFYEFQNENSGTIEN